MGGSAAGGSDVSNNGHHLGFYQELEVRFKTTRNGKFLCFSLTLHDFRHKIYFYC